ncbi:MAG: fumarate reductase subunit FrdD, partial [Vibrio sp.]|uniref:fumarate reductase subunit FrdD n=1 Tax=Vibrio sp. TaxID=678 RepID=UPI003A8B9A67
PLGIIDADKLSYERVVSFSTNIICALLIIATLSLQMWHAMHRIHNGMHDLKFTTGVVGKIACYAFAGAISVLAVVFIVMLMI